MKRYAECLQGWRNFFSEASEEQRQANKDKAVEQLDWHWKRKGHMDQPAVVSGYGQQFMVVREENYDTDDEVIIHLPTMQMLYVRHIGKISAVRAVSCGFNVVSIGDDRPNIRHVFDRSPEVMIKEDSSSMLLPDQEIVQPVPGIGMLIHSQIYIEPGTLEMAPLGKLPDRPNLG